jgi:hypothetical protein
MRSGTHAHKAVEAEGGGRTEIWELIQTLVSGRVPASRILELFYWSQEPGALEMLRIFLGLSSQDSAALLRFFAEAESSSVAISANDAGELVLSPSVRNGGSRMPHEPDKVKSALKHHRAAN